MKRLRFSIAQWMLIAMVVALNLGLMRQLARTRAFLPFEIMPALIVLELALLAVIQTRGKLRAFWTGFLGLGSLALASRALVFYFCESTAEWNSVTSSWRYTSKIGSFSTTDLYLFWRHVNVLLIEGIKHTLYPLYMADWVAVIVHFLAIILPAVVGGSLALLIVFSVGKFQRLRR